MKEVTIIRQNLMDDPNYTPYCGDSGCIFDCPRTTWDSTKEQFTCQCGWVSGFPKGFINRYISKWKNT